jgi:hypothetical protein
MAGTPAPPRDLARAGRDLWRRVLAAYELDPVERVGLALACRQLDDVARLEELLDRDGLIVAGSSGQPRLSAVVGELRLSRLAAARLLADLALPGEEVGTAATPAARRARRAAQARWAGHVRPADRGFDASA